MSSERRRDACGHDRSSAVVVVGDALLLGNWMETYFRNTNSS